MSGAATNLDWLFWLIGGCITAVAGVFLLWALFWDRSRGRRRCPKCWYDMAGVPGLTCPECGRAARAEKRLGRTRRRKRWAGFAVFMMLVGAGVASVPRYQASGWLSFVPSTVLVLFGPLDEPAVPVFNVAVQNTLGRGGWGTPPTTPVAPPTTTAQDLCEELWKRFNAGDMTSWQERVVLRRCMSLARPTPVVRVPERWPAAQPIWVQSEPPQVARLYTGSATVRLLESGPPVVTLCAWLGNEKGMAVKELPGRPAGEVSLCFDMTATSARASHSVTVSRSMLVTGDVDTFLERVDSPEVNEAVCAALNPRLVDIGGGVVKLVVNDRAPGPEWASIDYAVAYRFEIITDGRAVGSGSAFVRWKSDDQAHWLQPAVTWGSGGQTAALAPGATTEIAVRGDPSRAGEQYMLWPFGRRAVCWAGWFRVPLARGERPW